MSGASGQPASHNEEPTVDLRIGAPAAGGTCVAHHAGITYFVRGALPDELVRATVTGKVRSGRIRFATVTEVLEASPQRVEPPCTIAGVCGGCDLQHVARDFQLEWKSIVVRDQLRRVGGFESIAGLPLAEAVRVVKVDDDNGLGWRTRYAIESDESGDLGFHAHRSSAIIPTERCPVVVPELQEFIPMRQDPQHRWHVTSGETPTVWTESRTPTHLPPGWTFRSWHEREALGRRWRVATDGFWQAHRRAADVLGQRVQRYAEVRPDDVVVDLYAGVGLFAAAVSTAAEVIAVEGDERAIRLARRNLHDSPNIRLVHADVREFRYLRTVDVTVLDPPRAGAGSTVIERIAAHTSRTIVHVGCDTARTARDLRRLHDLGWMITRMDWFDLFPMTQHVESVTVLARA